MKRMKGENKMSEWISVKDEPPKPPCLFWDRDNGITLQTDMLTIRTEQGNVYAGRWVLELLRSGRLSKNQRGIWLQAMLDGRITGFEYWMPLPEPPDCANCFWHINGGKCGSGACMNDRSDYYCKRMAGEFSCEQWEKKEGKENGKHSFTEGNHGDEVFGDGRNQRGNP